MAEELPLLTPDLDDFHEAWHWLHDHPYFFYRDTKHFHNEPGFTDALDVYVVKVSPRTKKIVGDDRFNTLTQVWLEAGPWAVDTTWNGRAEGLPCHDTSLDTEADTFEGAVCAMARKVMAQHGSYPAYETCSHCLKRKPAGPTDPDDEWFCSESCTQCGPSAIRFEPVDDKPGYSRFVPPSERFDCEHWRPSP